MHPTIRFKTHASKSKRAAGIDREAVRLHHTMRTSFAVRLTRLVNRAEYCTRPGSRTAIVPLAPIDDPTTDS